MSFSYERVCCKCGKRFTVHSVVGVRCDTCSTVFDALCRTHLTRGQEERRVHEAKDAVCDREIITEGTLRKYVRSKRVCMPDFVEVLQIEPAVTLRDRAIGNMDYIFEDDSGYFGVEAKSICGFSGFWSASKIFAYCAVFNHASLIIEPLQPAMLLPFQGITDDLVYLAQYLGITVFSFQYIEEDDRVNIIRHRFHEGIRIGAPIDAEEIC